MRDNKLHTALIAHAGAATSVAGVPALPSALHPNAVDAAAVQAMVKLLSGEVVPTAETARALPAVRRFLDTHVTDNDPLWCVRNCVAAALRGATALEALPSWSVTELRDISRRACAAGINPAAAEPDLPMRAPLALAQRVQHLASEWTAKAMAEDEDVGVHWPQGSAAPPLLAVYADCRRHRLPPDDAPGTAVGVVRVIRSDGREQLYDIVVALLLDDEHQPSIGIVHKPGDAGADVMALRGPLAGEAMRNLWEKNVCSPTGYLQAGVGAIFVCVARAAERDIAEHVPPAAAAAGAASSVPSAAVGGAAGGAGGAGADSFASASELSATT